MMALVGAAVFLVGCAGVDKAGPSQREKAASSWAGPNVLRVVPKVKATVVHPGDSLPVEIEITNMSDRTVRGISPEEAFVTSYRVSDDPEVVTLMPFVEVGRYRADTRYAPHQTRRAIHKIVVPNTTGSSVEVFVVYYYDHKVRVPVAPRAPEEQPGK